MTTPQDLRSALAADDASTRLRAALAAGSAPDPALAGVLVERCAAEPDAFVRDMLSWALTRLPAADVLPRLRVELGSPWPRARAQALHTLSKIAAPSTWPWLTRDLLRDPEDDVARTAWRTAVVLAPTGERAALAGELAGQLGRGDRDVRLSLSRALVDLGDTAGAALARASEDTDPAVAAHAHATVALRADPDTGFDAAVAEAQRVVALGPGRGTMAGC